MVVFALVRQAPHLSAALWFALAGWALLGCEPKTTWVDTTQVVVQVRSDFADELESVEVELYDGDELSKGGSSRFTIDPQQGLPFFTVVPPAGSRRDAFLVLVRGRDSAGAVVEAKALVRFVKETTVELELWLRRGCIGTFCGAAQTCRAQEAGGGDCQPVTIATTVPVDPGSRSDAGVIVVETPSSVEDAATATNTSDASAGNSGSLDASGSAAGNDGGARDSGALGEVDSGSRDAAVSPDSSVIGVDGDLAAPVIALAEAPCRSILNMQTAANLTVNGRGIILDYPCDKHEGAQFTLILNLHGTVSGASAALGYYVRSYFAAYRNLSSHNLIIATPFALGAQWGNGDNGSDKTYLLGLVDWIYQKFGKANIRSTFIAAHNWGVMFSLGNSGLACDEGLRSRLRGAIAMSGGKPTATCLDRLSLITVQARQDVLPPFDTAPAAALHHCATPAAGPELLATNNERRYYTGCDGTFVHEDYVVATQASDASALDVAVVTRIIEALKRAEK